MSTSWLEIGVLHTWRFISKCSHQGHQESNTTTTESSEIKKTLEFPRASTSGYLDCAIHAVAIHKPSESLEVEAI